MIPERWVASHLQKLLNLRHLCCLRGKVILPCVFIADIFVSFHCSVVPLQTICHFNTGRLLKGTHKPCNDSSIFHTLLAFIRQKHLVFCMKGNFTCTRGYGNIFPQTKSALQKKSGLEWRGAVYHTSHGWHRFGLAKPRTPICQSLCHALIRWRSRDMWTDMGKWRSFEKRINRGIVMDSIRIFKGYVIHVLPI